MIDPLCGLAFMQESHRAVDSGRFRFGFFEFDAATRELRRGRRARSSPAAASASTLLSR